MGKLKGQKTTYHKNRSSHLVTTAFYFASPNCWQEPLSGSGWSRYSMVASGPNVFPSHAVLILSLPPSWVDASRVVVPGHGISCVTFLSERRDLGGKPPSSAPAARWQRPQPIRSTELRARPAGSPSPLPGLFSDQGPPPPPPRGRRGDLPA